MEVVMDQVKKILPGIHGWCSVEKAEKLVEYITTNKAKLCVEIGVFGGSSLIPQAMALKAMEAGKVVGIDPWSVEAALEEMKQEENRTWWGGKIDLESIYQNCRSHVAYLGLNPFVQLVRDKAENVVDQFENESIDVLHIDGNHSEELSYKDATLYLPKVKKGGTIFFDDIWWTDGNPDPTTRKAILFLLERCTRVELVGDCMILKKN